MIGGAKDPAEARADTRAADALSTAPTLHRKCAACEAEDKAFRAPAAGVVAPGAAPARASKTAETAVNSLGPGRPLSPPERAFYEPRLGADLSPVRLHEGAAANTAARAMDASAFTLGDDIAFADGERARGGAGLLAHELAHAAEEAPEVRRALKVHAPQTPIPRPEGKGVNQTNRETIETYLKQICNFGTPSVTAGGDVEMGLGECIIPDQLGVACGCLCEHIESEFESTIHVRDEVMKKPGFTTGPHTQAKDPEQAEGGRGSGSTVVVPSPNNTVEYGFADVSGKKMAFENWEVLAHELCGHARLSARGTHPRESRNREIRHGHETVVPMANAIRAEKGLGARQRGDTADDPYCGESFKRDKGAADFEDTNARHLGACRHLREIYLWKLQNARNQMTPEERAKLPKLKKAKDYDISERLPER